MINTIAKTTVLVTMIAATTLILASAQASASGVTQWSGTSNTYVDGCQFKENTVGTMSLVDNVWTVDVPATIKLETRKILSVDVFSDEILRDTNGDAVTDAIVDYTGSTVTAANDRTTLATTVTEATITVDGLKSKGASEFSINISGTATIDSDNELDSETDYNINHIVICIQ